MAKEFRLVMPDGPQSAKLWIDGIEVGQLACAVDITLGVNEIPQITLKIPGMISGEVEIEGDLDVTFNPELIALLKRIGWIQPGSISLPVKEPGND